MTTRERGLVSARRARVLSTIKRGRLGDGHDGGAVSWIWLTSVAILSVVSCSEKRKLNESVQAQEEKGMGIGGKRRGWERVFFGVS